MDPLKQIVKLINENVGNLINAAEMSEGDKVQLKGHLLAAQEILLRNGNVKLHDVVSNLTSAILSRF